MSQTTTEPKKKEYRSRIERRRDKIARLQAEYEEECKKLKEEEQKMHRLTAAQIKQKRGAALRMLGVAMEKILLMLENDDYENTRNTVIEVLKPAKDASSGQERYAQDNVRLIEWLLTTIDEKRAKKEDKK